MNNENNEVTLKDLIQEICPYGPTVNKNNLSVRAVTSKDDLQNATRHPFNIAK